jgi:hypothetical protein
MKKIHFALQLRRPELQLRLAAQQLRLHAQQFRLFAQLISPAAHLPVNLRALHNETLILTSEDVQEFYQIAVPHQTCSTSCPPLQPSAQANIRRQLHHRKLCLPLNQHAMYHRPIFSALEIHQLLMQP